MAAGYARYWAPVLAPAVAELVDWVAPRSPDSPRILDVGTGTGQLALWTLSCLPDAVVVGIDPSQGMLDVAVAEADRRLAVPDRERFQHLVAAAENVPLPDGTFDVALSSFVFQLVGNRAQVLRETRRLLAPGGLLAYVSWLDDERRFEPDEVFDDVLDEEGIERGGYDGRPGDLPSVDRAANEMRRAGFERVEARAGRIDHRFTVDGYIEFLTDFDEQTLFDEMEPDVRERVIRRFRARLARLSPAAMTLRYPIVFVSGYRSAR